MSHIRVKTTFQVEDGRGGFERHTLFVHHNLSCDIVSYFNEDGQFLFSVEDTTSDNLLDAINATYAPQEKDGTLSSGIEYMTKEDCEKCKI